MRVVCMVPSWTETLISAGIQVVGRTRFCIHPESVRQSSSLIPAVGGTKDWRLEEVKALKPDLIILDQEENPKFMAEESPCPCFVSHVDSIEAMSKELEKLASHFKGETSEQHLKKMSQSWQQIAAVPNRKWDWQNIPASLDKTNTQFPQPPEKLIYIIWKDPWMTVSKETFIGSVLTKLGAAPYQENFPTKYPKFNLNDFPKEKTHYLLSSEPYPFQKRKQEITNLNLQATYVDGEKYSWFGQRTQDFLIRELALK